MIVHNRLSSSLKLCARALMTIVCDNERVMTTGQVKKMERGLRCHLSSFTTASSAPIAIFAHGVET